MAHVLLIDDDVTIIPEQVRQAFSRPHDRVEVARTGAAGLDRVQAETPDVILLDLRLPDQSGLEVYEHIREIDARIPVIFITVAKSAEAAIDAMKRGAYDYLFKPLDLNELRRVVGEALEVSRRMREPALLAESTPDSDVEGAIIGTCPAMREVYKAIGRVTAQNVPVLITGESGTGKELVARAVYQHGERLEGAVPGAELRRDSGAASGERIVWTRKGFVHRRRAPSHREVRAGERRHAFSG